MSTSVRSDVKKYPYRYTNSLSPLEKVTSPLETVNRALFPKKRFPLKRITQNWYSERKETKLLNSKIGAKFSRLRFSSSIDVLTLFRMIRACD